MFLEGYEHHLLKSLFSPFPFILVYKSTSLLESVRSSYLEVCTFFFFLLSHQQCTKVSFPLSLRVCCQTLEFLPTWSVKTKCMPLIMSNVEHPLIYFGLFSLILYYPLFISFAIFFFGGCRYFSFRYFLGALCMWGILFFCDKMQVFFFQVCYLSFGSWHFLICKIFLFLNKFICKQIY